MLILRIDKIFLTFFATGVFAISALEGFFSCVGALVLYEGSFGGSRVDADVAAERLLARVSA